MKAQRAVIVALSILVVVLAYLAFSKHNKPEEASPVTTTASAPSAAAEQWRTNNVDRWFTNTVTITNTVVEPPVTNEVVKEVPAKLSAAERQAATTGYRHIHSPTLENASDALYKIEPVAVEVYADPSALSLLGENADQIRNNVEGVLRSHNIAAAEKSPHVLRIGLSPQWKMSDPRVALVRCKVDLKEPALVERQKDFIKCDSIVWSTSNAKFVRTINMSDGVDQCVQECVDRFINDCREAKDKEKQLEARVAKVPADFLSGSSQ